MTSALARLLRRLLGIRSPSEWVFVDGIPVRVKGFQARMVEGFRLGIEQANARRAELLASGMTPEEAQAVLVREMLSDPGLPALLDYSRGVVMRSFGTLYEDDDEDPTDTPPSAAGP